MTNDKLKLPVEYAPLSPEELEALGGGAPAWVNTIVCKTKDVLRPYKPLIMTTLAVLKPTLEIMVQLSVMVDAAREIKHCLDDIK